MKLLIVGNPSEEHVGAHFADAARAAGMEVRLVYLRLAFSGPLWKRRLFWHLLGHRPPAMVSFNRRVVAECTSWRPDILLSTGIAPLARDTLAAVRKLGVRTVNYQTDDPWSG